MKPTAVLKRIASLVKALLNYQPERIYLFGSWARGEQDDLSDVDLVIIKETSAPFFDRLQEAAANLPPGAGGTDIFVYTPEEFETMQHEGNAFALTVAAEGRLVYARTAQS